MRSPSTEVQLLDKKELEYKDEKDLQNVSFLKVLHLNKPDWPFVLTGVIVSAFIGVVFPAMAPLFSEILNVCVREVYIICGWEECISG